MTVFGAFLAGWGAGCTFTVLVVGALLAGGARRQRR